MERPTVRLIEDQQVESTTEVTGWEAEQLLRKYGHQPQQFSTRQEEVQQPEQPGYTFEEMVLQQEAREKELKMRRQQQINGPKPITFGGQNYDTETRYESDEDTGFGFKIQIVTDMKLPKY